jgi:hypothetical protein
MKTERTGQEVTATMQLRRSAMGTDGCDLENAARVPVKTCAYGQARWATAVCIPRDRYHIRARTTKHMLVSNQPMLSLPSLNTN